MSSAPERTPDLESPEPDVGPKDLGMGRVVANAVRGRFINRDGTTSSRKYGLGAQRAERFYLAALEASWPSFLGWLGGILLLTNGIFAVAFRSLGPDALMGAESLGLADPFLRALSFSVGVFTTTGTDGVHAHGSTANWLVIVESLVGLLFIILAAGLTMARLMRPVMRIRFSESIIVAPYEGGRGLMFRMVNESPSELSDVKVRVILIWFEMFDGVRERNFHVLELERDQVELFNLHWTVVHPINSKSPLRGLTPDDLRMSQAEIVVAVSAHEESFSTRVRQRMSYTWEEIRWDVKFASIFTSSADNVIAIDVERLSRTEPLAEGATRNPAAHEDGPAITLA
jgi:inward rectifier potassium channel